MGGGPPKDKLLCILPIPEPKQIVSHLRTTFPDIDIEYIPVTFDGSRWASPADIPPSTFSTATILFTLFTLPKHLSDSPHLKWVQLFSAGANHIESHPIYKDTDAIHITTASGVHGPQIAEWVIMTGLVASHNYKSLYEAQKRHQWARQQSDRSLRDRVGLRLGVLGYGSIGRQVARVAAALGMRVVAYTATAKDTAEKRRDRGYIVPGTGDEEGTVPEEWYSGVGKEALGRFLGADLDWLVVSVPLTRDTRGLIGEEELDVLSHKGKRPAFVTNIARGPVLVQDELIEALKDGRVSGAALDVTDPEPLPEDSELWGMENVIITPHISGVSDAYGERAFQVLEKNLHLWQKGEKLVNEVNRKTGY